MKKILVIEDEPDMRRNLTTILRLEKFLPLPAENGSIGLELAKKERPDLILCDVMMPELDGIRRDRCSQGQRGYCRYFLHPSRRRVKNLIFARE